MEIETRMTRSIRLKAPHESAAGGGGGSLDRILFREERFILAKKIDPLNKKNYTAVTAALCVTDVKAAAAFYQKAFGFQKRGIMNGPDGKPMHAELVMRGTALMLGPEMPAMGARSARNAGASPTTLYLLVDNADKTVAKAVKLGAKLLSPVADMFWGDRCGRLLDPEGYNWYIATHIADPTPAEMKKQMREDMKKWQPPRGDDAADTATNAS
jgi:PhnB protein